MNIQHSSTAETGSCIDSGFSERVQQAVGKEMQISFSLEQIERIECLERKYEDWVRKGIIVPQKYKPTLTPEEFALKHKIEGF